MSTRPQAQAPGAPSRATAPIRRARAQNTTAVSTATRPSHRAPDPQPQAANLSPDVAAFDDNDADVETEHTAAAPPFSIRRTLFPGTSSSNPREGRRDASTGSLRRGQQPRSAASSIAVADAFTTPTTTVGASMAHTYNASQPTNHPRAADPEDDILVRDAKGNVNSAFTGTDVNDLLSASLLEDEDEDDEPGADGVNANVDMSVLERYRSRTGMGIDQAELRAALDVSLREKLATLEQDRWMYEAIDLESEC